MSKTVIIPTDFSIVSLKLAQTAIEDHPGEKLNLVLVHGVHLTDSITELLFFSKNDVISCLSNPDFENACSLLQNLFSKQVNSLRTELFTGFTQSAFNSFLQGVGADKIYVPETPLKLTDKMSMDLSKFIARSQSEKVSVRINPSLNETTAFSRINFAK